MDKAVYDAICDCSVDREKYPHVYKWRHATGLYSKEEMERYALFILLFL